MKLYKEEESQQGSPKKQKDASVAVLSCSSLCPQRPMCRAAEGLFQRVLHLTLLQHPMASFKVQWRQEEVFSSNTNCFDHILHVNFHPCSQGEYVF